MTTPPYEHLSSKIYELLHVFDPSGRLAEEAQRLLRRKVHTDGSINTDKPLERVLAIVADQIQGRRESRYTEDVAFSSQYLRGDFQSIDKDGDGWTLNRASAHYKKLTDRILATPDFPYGREEAKLAGSLFEGSGAQAAIDRILLRKNLENVTDPAAREHIWYAITLSGTNFEVVEYLQQHCPSNTHTILREMETTLLSAYEQYLVQLETPQRSKDGIQRHGDIAYTRILTIKKVVEAAEFKIDYEPVNGRTMDKLLHWRKK
ncbi:hypothetical protein HYV86_03630 [Candidatus Woesearchaeota archaeon]|nr:hypothetical protein [Candidatus Woesearchaeota archaeon]